MGRRTQPSDIVIVAGMPRSGTTTLYHVLQQHPDVYVPFRKETCYFSFQVDRGADWYLRLFRRAPEASKVFDISANYFFVPEAIPRILEFNPDAKVILSIRDPGEYAISFYRLMANWDRFIEPFESFIDSYTFRFCRKTATLDFSNGMVSRQIGEFRQAFGDNLLLIDFRLFRTDMVRALQAIEAFSGLKSYFTQANVVNQPINASNRRNSRFVSHLLSRERVQAALYWCYPEVYPIFPEKLLRELRRWADSARVRQGDTALGGPSVSAEQKRLAGERFAEEGKEISALFKEGPILLGSGKQFN